MTAEVRRVLEDARAVFIRLDEDATRQLERSWRGDAGRRALEALRHYISEALDGLAGCLSFPGMPMPQMPALASPTVPVATLPAGFDPPPASSPLGAPTPMASHRNGFGEYGDAAPTHAAASPSVAPAMRAVPDTPSPLPPASLNAATAPTAPTVPPAAPTPAVPSGQARGGFPYMPLMGAAYPGAVGRDDAGMRPMPGFLISIDNGNELIGPLPKVSPPVLGADGRHRSA